MAAIEPESRDCKADLRLSADWLADPRLQRLMAVIAGDDEDVRVVGGAVRNVLMGRPVADVDLATTALPKVVMARTRRHDMRPIPTGIDHGTVTVIVSGKQYEVTTLRQDIVTDGRHAQVAFGRDWAADARRRDFTVNALYATADGSVIDYVGGIADCAARRIRFIGEPMDRIREDYLRILRLFRFHASYAEGPIDISALAAAIQLKDGILTLSGERIGQEILKLVAAPRAPDVVRVMHAAGILTLALGTEAIDPKRFTLSHHALMQVQDVNADVIPQSGIILLVSLNAGGPDGCEALARRLRLSNAVRNRMVAAEKWAPALLPDMSDQSIRAIAFRAGADTLCDASLLAAGNAAQDWNVAALLRLLEEVKNVKPPQPPISGSDLLAFGMSPGRKLGARLDQLIEQWIASDFTFTKQDLLASLAEDAADD